MCILFGLLHSNSATFLTFRWIVSISTGNVLRGVSLGFILASSKQSTQFSKLIVEDQFGSTRNTSEWVTFTNKCTKRDYKFYISFKWLLHALAPKCHPYGSQTQRGTISSTSVWEVQRHVVVCPVTIVLLVHLTCEMKMCLIWHPQLVQKFIVLVYVCRNLLTEF